jgi:mRNA interferase MazF
VGTPAAGAVVLVRFPFSDLSRSKLRPAVVLADAGRGDVVLCQVTSKPYGDDRAVTIAAADLVAGSLRVTSFARPGKIFTANEAIIATTVGSLRPDALARIRDAVVDLLRPESPSMPETRPGS